jgi:site-specific recombinase XerD
MHNCPNATRHSRIDGEGKTVICDSEATMNEIQLDDRTSIILVDEPAQDLFASAQVSPEDAERWHLWLDCENRWLGSLERRSGRTNTRRAYHRDVLDFFGAYAYCRLMPWQASAQHAEGWVQQLHAQGLTDTTINRKVAALSSFYHYANTEYIIGAAAEARALWPHPNPFASRSLRQKISTHAQAQFPSAVQVTALLNQIDIKTVTGLRNLGLLAGMFATTRRVDEWRNLRWGDIHDGAEGKWFTYRYKGGEIKQQVLPGDIWEIIQLYLKHAGRLETIQPADFIFTTTSAAGTRIRTKAGADQVRPDYDPARQAVGASYINALIKRYGAAAGIPAEKLHAHALRHAGARHRRQAGADVWSLQATLGHASIAITQRYTENVLDEPEDAYADTIGAILPKQLKLLLK